MPVQPANNMIKDGDSLAAVDLGSNSFHLVVARYEHGDLRVIDRLREVVRMAMGLRPDGTLEPDRHKLALACLARFGQRLRELPSGRVRAVATNTVRRLRSPRAFLLTAETALGHPIEVVSGREEARLIYLGVAHGVPASRNRRLVVDIGGGSTEFIIGQGLQAQETESLQMGCVASTLRFFADGKVTRRRWQKALTEIEMELQQFAADYRAIGWGEAIGSSGTVRALGAVSRAMGAILKQQFVVDPRVKGTVTLFSEQPITPREAYLNYLAALRGLGFEQLGDHRTYDGRRERSTIHVHVIRGDVFTLLYPVYY